MLSGKNDGRATRHTFTAQNTMAVTVGFTTQNHRLLILGLAAPETSLWTYKAALSQVPLLLHSSLRPA